jgi:16S rRNA (adenine1518-N6/adenine1519-N6)-dimethyltransferase
LVELYNRGELRELLTRHGLWQKKRLGQHFLTDRGALERTVAGAEIAKDCGVLEIGPGVGVLTRFLAAAAGKVAALELDTDLLPVLAETLADFDNCVVIGSDVMKADISEIVSSHFSGLRPVVCANLPYYITTPVLERLLASGLFESITVMIQKEVAQRICAAPGTAEYGSFSVFVRYYAEPKLLFTLQPGAFSPPPKVDSAVLRLDTHAAPLSGDAEKLFFKTLRAAFAQRRKTLANALVSGFYGGIDRETAVATITEAGFDPQIRGERLSLEAFIRLSAALGTRIDGSEPV